MYPRADREVSSGEITDRSCMAKSLSSLSSGMMSIPLDWVSLVLKWKVLGDRIELETLIFGLPSPRGVGAVIETGAAVGKMKSRFFW